MEYHIPKMVGRDKELDQLKRLLYAAINGKGNIVLVSGEAGIGKTRLVKEVEAYAELQGVKILEGRCARARANRAAEPSPNVSMAMDVYTTDGGKSRIADFVDRTGIPVEMI